MKTVFINLLGIELDNAPEDCKWTKWRPSVAVCQHKEISINEYHLIYQKKYNKLAENVRKDIQAVSPATKVILDEIEYRDPWDFEDVYEKCEIFV